MPARPRVSTPAALSIGAALEQCEPLSRLRELLHESNARFAAIAPLLPSGLAPHVRPGPVSEACWTLLAANAAVAAKLNQLKPRLESALNSGGWGNCAIVVRVQPS